MFPVEAIATIRRFQSAAPVRIVGLAEELGLRVWLEHLPQGVSGKLVKSSEDGGSSGFAIYVNRTEHSNRQRFTVAHEIAHFLLHRKALDDGEIVDDTFYRSRLSNAMEAEANRAAAELLMPYDLISRATERGVDTPAGLADLFKVSEAAMRIRLGLPT
jgi:hypothetical protein